MKNLKLAQFLSVLLAALTCAAKEPPAPSPRIVDLTAADGVKLKASYFSLSRKKPGPGILLLHQCDHDRKIWDGLAGQLAAAGFNVLTMDLRGFGESGGEPHNSGKPGPIEPPEEMQKWPGDIDVAFQYLKSQPGVKPDVIGAAGASCGVSNAIKTAIRHPEVKSLVLLSGPTDLQDRQFMRQGSVPAFFAVADDDQYSLMVPLTESIYLVTGNPGKKFVHYQTGHHGAEMFAVHPELAAAIVDWYVFTLIKTPGRAPAPKDAPAILGEVQTWDLLEQPGGPAKLAQKLFESRRNDPQASLVSAQMVSESREKDPKAIEVRMEQMIDSLADQHFDGGDVKQALEIAKLGVLAYPNSPMAHAVLSECYLSEGEKGLARQNAQKALDVLSSDTVYGQVVHDAIKDGVQQILKRLDGAQ